MSPMYRDLEQTIRRVKKNQALLFAPSFIPIFVQTASKTVANTVTETTLLTTGIGSLSVSANRFLPGTTLKVKASGYHSTDASPPKLTITVKLGTISLGFTQITHIGATSSDGWLLDLDATCRTPGVGGQFYAQGKVLVAENTPFWPMTNSSLIYIDTTASQTVDITATWDTAESTATITCTNVEIYLVH